MSTLPSPLSGKKPTKAAKPAVQVNQSAQATPAPVAPAAKKPVLSKKAAEKSVNQAAKKKKRKQLPWGKTRIPYPYYHLGIGLFLTVLIVGGIIYTSRKLVNLAQETEMSRSQLTAMRDRDLSLKKLSQDLQLVAREEEIISQALPDEAGVINFVREFRKISHDVSLGVFNFQTDQPIVDELGNAYIDFSVELRGSFVNLKNFLTRLVNLPYLIKLQLVDIAGADQEEAIMVVSARIYVNDVFFPEGGR